MSSPQTPKKGSSKFIKKNISIDNSFIRSRNSKQQNSRVFITWYKQLMDNERQNLGLYLSDDVMLQWFGRTIKTRKIVSSFFKDDVEFSKHYFTSVESIDKIKLRTPPRKSLSSPSCSPDKIVPKNGKRKLFESCDNSPEWAPGCKPDDEFYRSDRKKRKTKNNDLTDFEHNLQCSNEQACNNSFGINNKGDGVGKQRKLDTITPPNMECGQGDCMPSTSSDSNRSHEALNAQLPKLATECNGYVEFTRTRNNHNVDCAKWERKFKLQISYSEDPLNIGEFIIWGIWYSDESKCRRNLLAAFNEVAQESKNG